MREAEILDALGEIFEDVFQRPVPLRPTLTAGDVADWDSFKQIDIILAVQERFGIKAATRDWDALTSVGDLVALIAAKAA